MLEKAHLSTNAVAPLDRKPRERIRLLIISQPPFGPGGVPAMLRWLCRALQDEGGYLPTVLCVSDILPPDTDWASGEVVVRYPKFVASHFSESIRYAAKAGSEPSVERPYELIRPSKL